MKFTTLDYNNLNYIIRKRNLKFKHDSELSHYFKNHPELIKESMTKPLPFTVAISMAVQFYIPELRRAEDVKAVCQFNHRHLSLRFYIDYANLRHYSYWKRLRNDVRHSKSIPLYMITPFLHRIKPAFLNFYRLWTEHPYKLVFFNYINEIKPEELKSNQRLYYIGQDIRRHRFNVNLNQELHNNQIKLVHVLSNDTAFYLVKSYQCYIQSQRLMKKVVSSNHDDS